ncbi:MAG TPA: diguanylate cyclase [Kiritimatiellia bacterium]|nr:diguanylate cyclase [Kiritimatiellia bacterium]HRZ13039.1 diguanylate cyclase [Kiritimatiellia bacterium]HSA18351.1 diguanylate cyclase [Kiritimatiellia bacterium]
MTNPEHEPPVPDGEWKAQLAESEQRIRQLQGQLEITTSLLRESENNLRRMAHLDALTGLFNRRGLEQELRRAWALAERQKASVGLLVIDVDRFKMLNDTHGHPVGDQVLRECAELLKTGLRASDVLCRYGGDEMIVVLPLADPAETQAVATRILESVRDHRFCAGRQDLRITISVGSACGRPEPGSTPDELLIEADQALYRAKQGGRNCAVFWEPRPPSAEARTPASKPPADPLPPGRVMIVDDDPLLGSQMQRILETEKHDAVVHSAGRPAREQMEREAGRFDVVLVDLYLKGESGWDLLQALRGQDDTLVGIVVTGAATMDNAVEALRSGAFDFIAKPFEPDLLRAVVDRALRYRRLLLENRRYQQHLEELVREKSAALIRALERLRTSYQFTLEALAAMLDAREKKTGEHSKRVAEMTRILARAMGVPEDQVESMSQGALLHDIGKIAIPDAILLKNGPLSDAEWEVMRTHPEIGFRILRSSPELEPAAEIVRSHQERWDGWGYPRGLGGSAICLGARIFAVADAYDAIRASRPYAAGQSRDAALAEIRRHRGTQFDPEVVDILARCLPDIEALGWWAEGPASAG